MTAERAREINGLLFDHSMWHLGVRDEKPGSLQDVSLEEMIQATRIVQAENDAAGKKLGQHTITVVCADRLIAALYTAYHYHSSEEGRVESICAAVDGRMVVVLDQRFAKQEQEDEAA